jgi:Bacterial Ig domain
MSRIIFSVSIFIGFVLFFSTDLSASTSVTQQKKQLTAISVSSKTFYGRNGRSGTLSGGLLTVAEQFQNGVSVSISSTTPVDHGSFILIGNTGNYSYIPEQNYTGDAILTFTACGGAECVNRTLTLVKPNSAPIANPDYYAGYGFSAITLNPAPYHNDTDPDCGSSPLPNPICSSNDNPVVTIESIPTNAGGTATVLFANGAFNYARPYALFSGYDSFQYKLRDAWAGTTGTINLWVFPLDGAENFGESCAVV